MSPDSFGRDEPFPDKVVKPEFILVRYSRSDSGVRSTEVGLIASMGILSPLLAPIEDGLFGQILRCRGVRG